MTKAFNELYEELRKKVVDETVRRLQKKWEDDETNGKEFTSDDVIDIKVEIEDELIRELRDDIEHCFDEDTSDTFTEIQEIMEEDGFTITEEE